MNPLQQLQERVDSLEYMLMQILKGDKYLFNKNIEIGTGFDLKQGSGGKFGVFGAAPVTQPQGGGTNTDGHFAGGGTGLSLSDQFAGTGHSGGAKFTLPEVVGALKDLGLLKT